MPLLILNISLYLKFCLFLKKSLCIYTVCVYLSFPFQGFHGNLDVLEFSTLYLYIN